MVRAGYRAQRAVLMVDACQSGSLAEDRVTRSGVEQYTSTQHLNEAIGRAVLSATTDDKPAAEGMGDTASSPMRCWRACRRRMPTRTAWSTSAELGRFVQNEVPALTQR